MSQKSLPRPPRIVTCGRYESCQACEVEVGKLRVLLLTLILRDGDVVRLSVEDGDIAIAAMPDTTSDVSANSLGSAADNLSPAGSEARTLEILEDMDEDVDKTRAHG